MSAAQAGTSVALGRLVEVSEDVFAYVQPDGSWGLNNTGVLVGRRGVLAIDACSTERRTRRLLEVIRQVSDQPVRTLVNTHHHGDHTHGNYLFGGATVVGHERTREEILRAGLVPPSSDFWEPVEWGALELAPPFLTFRDGVTLWADDLRCEVRHVGTAAHTSNDSYVWLPDRSLLFCGDLVFSGGTPYVAMGSVTGSIEVLEEVVRPLGARTLVPGHGEVCGPEVLDTVLGYLRFVQRTAACGHASGRSPLDVAQGTDLGEFAGLTDSERLVGNLHRAYAELDGAPRGAPLDYRAVVRDMVAFNGGAPCPAPEIREDQRHALVYLPLPRHRRGRRGAGGRRSRAWRPRDRPAARPVRRRR